MRREHWELNTLCTHDSPSEHLPILPSSNTAFSCLRVLIPTRPAPAIGLVQGHASRSALSGGLEVCTGAGRPPAAKNMEPSPPLSITTLSSTLTKRSRSRDSRHPSEKSKEDLETAQKNGPALKKNGVVRVPAFLKQSKAGTLFQLGSRA